MPYFEHMGKRGVYVEIAHMTKPHEETWEALSGLGAEGWVVEPSTKTNVALVAIPDFTREARAKLIAQAPAMARLLLRFRDDEEVADHVLSPAGSAVGDELWAELDAVLKAAGVIE